MVLLKNFLQNLIKLYTKTHQIAPFKKISGGMPPNPLSIATCKLPNLRKKILGPPCQILATPLGFTREEFGTFKDYMTISYE